MFDPLPLMMLGALVGLLLGALTRLLVHPAPDPEIGRVVRLSVTLASLGALAASTIDAGFGAGAVIVIALSGLPALLQARHERRGEDGAQ